MFRTVDVYEIDAVKAAVHRISNLLHEADVKTDNTRERGVSIAFSALYCMTCPSGASARRCLITDVRWSRYLSSNNIPTPTMTNVHSGSVALSFRASAFKGTVYCANSVLKLPNFDDIYDLAKRVQESTDALSRLVLNETKWKNGLSPDHCQLLEGSVNQFRVFCEDAVKLLQTFSIFSQRFAVLLGLMFDPECQSSLGRFASTLQSDIESISIRISSVEQNYATFTSRFRALLRIAPNRRNRWDFHQDRKIFQRLDAFWKVVATQLSSVLERRLEPPHPNTSSEARIKWLEYKGCLLAAIDALTQSSDALIVGTDGVRAYQNSRVPLSGHVKRGFNVFWLKVVPVLFPCVDGDPGVVSPLADPPANRGVPERE